MIVNTRNGLFANAGFGGGIFNNNMSLGSVESTSRSVGGLGEIPATSRAIPSACTSKQAFKDCYDVAVSEAALMCEYCRENPDDAICAGYDSNTCEENVANQMAWDNCVPNFCPASDPSMPALSFSPYKTGDPCGSKNTIQNVQHMVGASPDGIWGPLSQKAYDTNKSVFGSSYCDLVPGCTGNSPVGPGCDEAAPKEVPVPVLDAPPAEEVQPVKGNTTGLLVGTVLIGGLMTAAWIWGGKKNKRK